MYTIPGSNPHRIGSGFSSWEVIVETVGDRSATCLHAATNKRVEIALYPVRVPLKPQPGDHWIVDQTFGSWSFAALVSGQAPW